LIFTRLRILKYSAKLFAKLIKRYKEQPFIAEVKYFTKASQEINSSTL